MVVFFVLYSLIFFALGVPFGPMVMSNEGYTVQVGNEAFASPSFSHWRPGGVDFKIDRGLLIFEGRNYPLSHHAHVLFRDGQVSIEKPAQ